MKITRTKSDSYWKNLKGKLSNDFDNQDLWTEAFDLFIERINSRYLDHSNLIENHGKESGEGFAIMAIYCTLIEFLETTYQGKNFKLNEPRNEFEYGLGRSEEFFKTFFKRLPFNFSDELARDFYKNIRCPLLHEAQTSSQWKLRVGPGPVFYQQDGFNIINRKAFKRKLDKYFLLYKKELLSNKELKEAFIRKFDGICSI